MNKYWTIALLVSFIAWSGFMYHEGLSKETALCGQADAKHDVAQQQVTIAAQQAVIAKIGQAETITKKEEQNYEKDSAIIDDSYGPSLYPTTASTGGSLRPHAAAAPGTSPASCARKSKVYKLTFEQCDLVKAGFNALWDDWAAQAANQ